MVDHLHETDAFLQNVIEEYGDDMLLACRDVLASWPPNKPFSPFSVIAQARSRLQESDIAQIAALNACPFDGDDVEKK